MRDRQVPGRRLGVEMPGSVRSLDDRDRQRPVAVTDLKGGSARLHLDNLMFLVKRVEKPGRSPASE
jgi:hypothetical protein